MLFLLLLLGIDLQTNIHKTCYASGLPLNTDNKQLCNSMCKYLLTSRSDNTCKKYFSYFTKWEQFIVSKGQKSLPADPVHVALYITHLLDHGSSYHVVVSCKYAIKWFHDLCGFPDPTCNSFVINLVESAKRNCISKPVKKDPISVEILQQLCNSYLSSNDLLVIRDLAMILLGFAGFLRFDELSSLRCNDICFKHEGLCIRILKSKTDQYREGNDIIISRGESAACPVAMLQRYFSVAEISHASDHFLFKPVFRSGSTCKLLYKNKPLKYIRTRECVLGRLKPFCGLHSLRAGGATTAANAGVNDGCWKRHGRWKSETAKDGYVADSLQSRLSVTKALKLWCIFPYIFYFSVATCPANCYYDFV